MISLESARRSLGKEVVYNAQGGGQTERGTIDSVNDAYVFVLYLGDRHAKATHPDSLDFVGYQTCSD